jgi:hypothetical protein
MRLIQKLKSNIKSFIFRFFNYLFSGGPGFNVIETPA